MPSPADLAIIMVLAVAGSVAVPRAAHAQTRERPPVHYEPMRVANGCFVESVACFDLFRESAGEDAWARVLQWGAQDAEVMVAGHAVAIVESSDRLWCFDINHGWSPLPVDPVQRDAAEAVAAPVISKYPRITAFYPVLWSDSVQPPGTPYSEPASSEEVAHDAGLVAARLSRHRPVNLVEFSVPENGESRTSEAVVFVFGGRMCVYAPEKGTVIFRAPRTTVGNIRLVQEMLRRMFSGPERVRTLPAG